MVWFFSMWTLFGTATGLLMIGRTPVTEHYVMFVLVSSAAVGLLVATSTQALTFYRELRRLRALKQFIWNWADTLHLQNTVIEALKEEASYVKAASETLIKLQKKGLETVECVEAWSNFSDEKGLTNAFDGVKSRMTQRFNEAQDSFYDDYDGIAMFAELVRVKLRARSWKAYTTEPIEVDTNK